MIEIVKEKVINTSYVVYQATDGTEFTNKEDCKMYEDSARGVLRGKLHKLVVAKVNAWELLRGYEDNDVLVIKLTKDTDVDIVLQNYYLDQPWILREEHKDKLKELVDTVTEAYNNKDLLLLGVNCDEDLYLMGTRNSIIDNLKNLDKKKK